MKARPGLLTLAIAFTAGLALTSTASAARTAYFADPVADEIAQFAVGPGGTLTPLVPGAVAADGALRLAMTPEGDDLYATADDGILQFDVAADGRLTPKAPALVSGERHSPSLPHAIAVHPDGRSAYVTDRLGGKVLQYDIGPGGRLAPKGVAAVPAGPFASGIAVRPDGRTAYVLIADGIVVFDVGAGGALHRRPEPVDIPGSGPTDIALTPDGRHLYATSVDGRVLQFAVAANGTPTPKAPASLDLGPGVKPVGIAVIPDGSAVYVTSQAHGARRVFAFAVGAGGNLAPGISPPASVDTPKLWFLTASPDGKSLFAAGGDGHLFDIGPGGSLAPKSAPAVALKGAFGVVVSPNQAPIASFAASAATAGAATRFDASSAVDRDGFIVRYDWDFGDGTVLLDGGPTPTHVYTRPGTYTATLVVTDNEGASTTTVFTGGTVLGNGTPAAQTSRAIRVVAAAPPTLPPPPAVPPPLAPTQGLQPELGETLLADPVRGRIRVRLPGEQRFQRLSDIDELPVGSTIDARRGRVELTTVRDRRNRLQDGVFHAGVFTVRQRARDRFVTELVLRGSIGSCPRRSRAGTAAGTVAQAAAAARRRGRRRLWGNARGRFRSRGRYSSAAVRGTRWLVEDRCDGTLTRVAQGTVTVRDFVRDRRVVLRRGQRYLARPR